MFNKFLRPVNMLFYLVQHFLSVCEDGNISELTCVPRDAVGRWCLDHSTSWTVEVFVATGKVTNVE